MEAGNKAGPSISTVLVANRGEIAVRVMRTAKALGLRTVAVYSDADADALHVQVADTAVRLGPAPVGESYLRADLVVQAARQSGADAIHPGYGFLSENADFAEAVEAAGMVFIGPSRHAIEIMGDKARAKRAMLEAGVPCVPGYQGEDQSDPMLVQQAAEIGFPIMVKAAAGGGGRGMRLVNDPAALPEALQLARSEAESAFGAGDLILERAVQNPRHVEFQIFADRHGNVVHLGERDCSVQRRHQKVIEEAPCPVMTPELRERMGQAAVNAARAVDYQGAGTVEFLLDQDGAFYFLEMNTRLQVEHPVTEAVTGLDLVALQVRVAAGLPLGLTQDEVQLSGHAIEVRLYAEDADNGFLPSTGPLALFQTPNLPGLRVDSGLKPQDDVSPYYDPMVAKIIGCGEDREQARMKLLAGLAETAFFGPKCNRDFLLDALKRPTFIAGEATTGFIADVYGDDGYAAGALDEGEQAMAAVLLYLRKRDHAAAASLAVCDELLDWSSDGGLSSVFVGGEAGETHRVHSLDKNRYSVRIGDQSVTVRVREFQETTARLEVAGQGVSVAHCVDDEGALHLATPTRIFTYQDAAAGRGAEGETGGGRVVAPMHGKLLSVDAVQGETVTQGQRVAVLEAMKMQHEILAPISGRVTDVLGQAGSQVAADDLLLQIEADDQGESNT
ncbi:MAG: biotin carboxylase N-terminal domain-containing protein [Alphaproteobacteria bacterium]